MSVEDYIINPRPVPRGSREMFGKYIAERPVWTMNRFRMSTVSLPSNWMMDYRLIKAKYQGQYVWRRKE